MSQAYQTGFIEKCAEFGVDPNLLMQYHSQTPLEKEAFIGKAIGGLGRMIANAGQKMQTGPTVGSMAGRMGGAIADGARSAAGAVGNAASRASQAVGNAAAGAKNMATGFTNSGAAEGARMQAGRAASRFNKLSPNAQQTAQGAKAEQAMDAAARTSRQMGMGAAARENLGAMRAGMNQNLNSLDSIKNVAGRRFADNGTAATMANVGKRTAQGVLGAGALGGGYLAAKGMGLDQVGADMGSSVAEMGSNAMAQGQEMMGNAAASGRAFLGEGSSHINDAIGRVSSGFSQLPALGNEYMNRIGNAGQALIGE